MNAAYFPSFFEASNPVMKLSLAKKHHLSKAEMLPVAKKKKIGKLKEYYNVVQCHSTHSLISLDLWWNFV